MASEEAKVIQAENGTEVLTAFNRIPYALINAELGSGCSDTIEELTQICQYYKSYKMGASFSVEGSNGDYVPATLKLKMAASLIDKEARFLFAEPPDIKVDAKGISGKVSEETKEQLTIYNDLIKTILEKNKFEDALLKGAKDCFIAKRIAILVNFNEDDGVTITFLPATQFIYETKIGNPNIIEKFVAFVIVKDSKNNSDKRIFKKKFYLHEDKVMLEEILYDGCGREIEVVTENQECSIPIIPAVVVTNDGLSNEDLGESEIEKLCDFEAWYSKLSNADIDAERKSMNPTKYVVDMESASTKKLSTAAGSLWDLGSDQNLPNAKPMVGLLEPQMNFSESLKITLDRIKTTCYESVDIPNITQETLVGTITSGKALKAIYWPLIVRCKEKMKVWGPALRDMVDIIIQGALTFPDTIVKYTDAHLIPLSYEVHVDQNTPLPEDEIEERNIDLAEVETKAMSRKFYMQKWRNLTDDEVEQELMQIALERQILEDASFSTTSAAPTNNQNGEANAAQSGFEDNPPEEDFSEDEEDDLNVVSE